MGAWDAEPLEVEGVRDVDRLLDCLARAPPECMPQIKPCIEDCLAKGRDCNDCIVYCRNITCSWGGTGEA